MNRITRKQLEENASLVMVLSQENERKITGMILIQLIYSKLQILYLKRIFKSKMLVIHTFKSFM
jgi:hypothetical protein